MGGSNPVSKVIKKVTKPVAKVLDKIVPNEIKPALPYLAAAFPFLAPGAMSYMAGGLGSLGISNPMIQRALISGGLNLASQLPQEGAAERGINPLSLALAAGTGALTAPTGADTLRGMQSYANLGDIGTETATRSLLEKAGDFGLETLAKGSEFLSAGASPEASLMQSIKAAAPSVGMAATEQAVLAAQKAKEDYEKEYQGWQDFTGQQLADFSAGRRAAILASMTRAGLDDDTITSTLASLGLRNGGRVGYSNAGIVSLTDEDSGVMYYDENEKPINKEQAMKLFNQQAEEENNSRPLNREDILQFYSDTHTTSKILDKILKDKEFKDPNDYRRLERIINEYGDGKYDLDTTNYPDKKELMNAEKYFDKFNVDTRGVDTKLNNILMDQGSEEFGKLYNYGKVEYNSPEGIQIVADKLGVSFEKAKDIKDVFENRLVNMNLKAKMKDRGIDMKANGGIIGLMGGGMPSMEMDYRGGGFIPVGVQERADDVPARLSKNEFVMTADAVRAAGGGSVNEGARRMYELMNNLEAKA